MQIIVIYFGVILLAWCRIQMAYYFQMRRLNECCDAAKGANISLCKVFDIAYDTVSYDRIVYDVRHWTYRGFYPKTAAQLIEEKGLAHADTQ